jgi:8-oxo-dGTP diphosphatase
MSNSSVTKVAVGVLLNDCGEVLISLRHPDSHQGGFWEFPGGKLEAGEDFQAALKREFAEELGIEIINCTPLTQIRHHYADKSVLLDVWLITEHRGQAAGLEGQAIAWKPIHSLPATDFPAANLSIIKLLQLPPSIAITPDCESFEKS